MVIHTTSGSVHVGLYQDGYGKRCMPLGYEDWLLASCGRVDFRL